MSFPRPLTEKEKALTKWLLEHGNKDSKKFLAQLEKAQVISECECGCASIDFVIEGFPYEHKSGLYVISDYLFERSKEEQFGVFIFTQDNILSGMETYSFCVKPAPLPEVQELMPFEKGYF